MSTPHCPFCSHGMLHDGPCPEPPPRPGGVACWESLLQSGLVPASLRPLCEARDALGRSRYGRPLEAGNGRDAARDCLEELLDGAVYAWQVWLETGEDEWYALATAQMLEAEWVARRVRRVKP